MMIPDDFMIILGIPVSCKYICFLIDDLTLFRLGFLGLLRTGEGDIFIPPCFSIIDCFSFSNFVSSLIFYSHVLMFTGFPWLQATIQKK